MSSQPDRSRNSRWGDRKVPSSNNCSGRGGTEEVTDEEALQALLTSAQEREKSEREAAVSKGTHHNRKRGRDDRDRNHPRDSGRPRQDQRTVENEKSYYGPAAEDRTRDKTKRNGDNENSDGNEDDDDEGKDDETKPTHKPNFGLSGALSKDTGGNVYKGVQLKFQEPPEARAPNTQWRFYVFKGKELLETLHISKQSAYLCGRNADICDIHMAHPSLSSQHAVLQYRALPHKETGRLSCQPYIMDLESTNGTFLNGVRLDPARYYQLKKGDVLTFGASTREYVLLTANTTELR